jgi:RimJ/RimL family protein N-acetyltransferase
MSQDVKLRAVEDGDIGVFFEHQADPVAVAMAAFPARDRERFDAHWARIRLDDANVVRTILADGVVAGNICGWQDRGQWFVGYWIGREFWGHGVATQALALFAGELAARPLYAHVAVHNVGSARVLEKCGFRRDPVQQAQAAEPEDGAGEFIFVLAA